MTEIGTSPQHARHATGRFGLLRRRRRDQSANQQSVDTSSSNCSNSGRNPSFQQRCTGNIAPTPSSTRAMSSSNSIPATSSTSPGSTAPTQAGDATRAVVIPNSTVETFCSYLIPSSSNDGQTITHFFATRQRSDLSWTLSETEQRAYTYVFDAWDETGSNVHVPGSKAVEIFDRAELDRAILAQIWDIVDSDDQGELSLEGFVISLALIIRRLHGISIPEELPAEMLPAEDLTSYLDRRPSSPTQPLDLAGLSESSQPAVDPMSPVIPPVQRLHYEGVDGERHPDVPPPLPPRPPELRRSLATMMEFPSPSNSPVGTPVSFRSMPNPWSDENSVDTFAWGHDPSSRPESPIRTLSPSPLQSEQLIQSAGSQIISETVLDGAIVSPSRIPTEAPPPYSASELAHRKTPTPSETVPPSTSATGENTTLTDPPPTRPPPRAVSPLRPRRRSNVQAEAALADRATAQSSSEASSSVTVPIAQHDDPDSLSTLVIHPSDQPQNQNNNDQTEPLSPRMLPKPKRPAPKVPSRSLSIVTPARDVENQPIFTDGVHVHMARSDFSQPTPLSTATNPFEPDPSQEQESADPVKPSSSRRSLPKPRRPPPAIPLRLPEINSSDNLADQPPFSEASDSTSAAVSENQPDIEDNSPSTVVNPFESPADEQCDQGSTGSMATLSPRRPPKPPRPPPRIPPAIPARPPSLALHRSKSSPVSRVTSPVSVPAPKSASPSVEKTSPLAGEPPSRETGFSAFASVKSDLSTSVVSLPKEMDESLSPRRSSERRRPPPIAPRPASPASYRAKKSPDAVIPLSVPLKTGKLSPPRVLRSPSNASGEMDLSPFTTTRPASEDPSITSIDPLDSLLTQESEVAAQASGSDFDRPAITSPALVVASPEQEYEHEPAPEPEHEQATEIQIHHTLPEGLTSDISRPVLRPSISNADLPSPRAASASAPPSKSTPPLFPPDTDAPKTPLTPASPLQRRASEPATISIVDPLDELPSSLSHILTEAMRSMSADGSDSDVVGKPRLHTLHGSRRYSMKYFRAASSPSIMDVVPTGAAAAGHDGGALRGDRRGKRRTLAHAGWRRNPTMVVGEEGDGDGIPLADSEEHSERDGEGIESSRVVPVRVHQRTVSAPAGAFTSVVEDEELRQDNAEEQAEEGEAEADQNDDNYSHDDLLTVNEFGQPTLQSHSSPASPTLSGMSSPPSFGTSSTMQPSGSGSHNFSRSLSSRMQRSISALAPHSRHQYCDDYKAKRDEGNHDLTMREYKWRTSYVGKVSRKISAMI